MVPLRIAQSDETVVGEDLYMSAESPWRKLGGRLIYENPWIKVREDQVVSPTGREGMYGVVETRIATGIVALTDDQRVFMVGQYRYPTDMYSWEIPEGGAELGEDPLVAAQRELKEEAGVVASHWEPLGSEIHVSNCISNERAFLYLARGLAEGKSCPDETELLQVKTLPLTECVNMVERGEIVDSLTIIAVLRVARLLGL